MFPVRECIKQEDGLAPVLLNFALEYAIKTVQETQVELKLNGTYEYTRMYYTDFTLWKDNTKIIKKCKEALSGAIWKQVYK
jgi:hypothetical protein